MTRHPWRLAMAGLVLAGCATAAGGTAPGTSAPATAGTRPTATEPAPTATTAAPVGTSSTTSPSTSTTRSSTPSTSSTSTTSSTTTTTIDPGPIDYDALDAVVAGLAADNAAVSVSVWRDGRADHGVHSGTRADGRPADGDSPFVIASVSKLVTALSVARLVQQGRIDPAGLVPWDDLGIAHEATWDETTVRQLLAHTSGMPEARMTWLDDPGSCRVPLEQALAAPPTDDRFTWHYSNGNYCALGLLVEHVTGLDLDDAAYDLVFAPVGIDGPYLSTDGLRGDSVPYAKGLARMSRLGGAGTWLASTDDVAAMLAAVTYTDRATLEWPGIILDQYGWGHTGSLDGAEACAWVLQDGYTVITAFVSGSKPNTGGKLCDRVVPALALDLGIFDGEPVRTPD